MDTYKGTSPELLVGRPSKALPIVYCEICDAPLSRYRDPDEIVCAFHPKVLQPKGTYNVADLKKAMKEGKEALEELGYVEVGMAGNNHLVMEHPFAGRLYVSGSPATIEGEVLRKVLKAKRAIKLVNQDVEGFVEYLRKKYNVPGDSSVVVQTTMAKEVRQYSDKIHKRLPTSFVRPVVDGGYVKMLKKGQAKNPSTIEIMGKHYSPITDDKPEPSNADIARQSEAELASANDPICGEQHPKYPAVWCTDKPDHYGMHTSEAVDSGWYTVTDEPKPPIKAKIDVFTPGMKRAAKLGDKIGNAAIAAVGVSADDKPQVADVTSEPADVKTPQGAEAVLEAMRTLLAPDATANAVKLAQCKELVKAYRQAIDNAYDILYALENVLDS